MYARLGGTSHTHGSIVLMSNISTPSGHLKNPLARPKPRFVPKRLLLSSVGDYEYQHENPQEILIIFERCSDRNGMGGFAACELVYLLFSLRKPVVGPRNGAIEYFHIIRPGPFEYNHCGGPLLTARYYMKIIIRYTGTYIRPTKWKKMRFILNPIFDHVSKNGR